VNKLKKVYFLLALIFSPLINASIPLVSPSWLVKHLDDDAIYLLDIRSKEFFDYVRIPSSVHSDYSQWRQPQSDILQKMLPSKKYLEKLLSTSGIKNSSHIIIISAGESASDIAAASRVYWTLEQMGHTQKSILNGGFIAWAKSKYPLTQAKVMPAKVSAYNIALIKPQLDAAKILKTINNAQIIDVRSVAEYKGLIASADERKGALINAQSLPYDWFINQTGQFHSVANLKSIAASISYNNTKQSIIYCHTGHRAALSWFVFHELLGNKQATLYDGSTRDWATHSNLPMTQAIHVQ